MQTEQRFKELLDKYVAGTCSPQEKAIMELWFEKGGKHSKAAIELDDFKRMQLLDKIHALQDKQVSDSISSPVRKLRVLVSGWRAAAVWIGLLLTASIAVWKSGIIHPFIHTSESVIAFRLIQTGKGEIKRIILPDSSVVMLNANSRLEYHPDFAKCRQIRLSGEALFSVTHDKAHPFIVRTSDSINTTVLGTRFNIQSYDKGQDIRIAVVSGIVAVGRAESSLDTLTKSQALCYQKYSRSRIISHDINVESTTGWIKGEWDYENFRFSDLVILLQNHYGITVNSHRNTELLQTGVSVNFNNKQSAKEILEVFCAFAGCHFRQTSPTEIEIH